MRQRIARRSLPVLTLVLALALTLALMAPRPVPAQEEEPSIQDNSFLIEEAYNQGPDEVQHIGTWERADEGDDWVFTFTQEWPLFGERHQLSWSLPWEHGQEGGGAGDASVGYRYQLVGDAEALVAIAPSFSLTFGTGDEEEGRGSGAAGYEVVLPVSVVLGERWVTHLNLGAAWTPGARNEAGEEADVTSYTVGQSLVWLARPRLNLLLEAVYESGEEVAGPGRTAGDDGFWVSPGVRWAYNRPGGLQIVPGIAWTIGAGPSSGEQSIFVYLSFEHPFR